MKASNNYLALRNQTGHYYLNGNWRIDYPQQFEAAGLLLFVRMRTSPIPTTTFHPSIHLFHPRNNIPLREKVQELEGTGSPHPLCTREHSGSGTNNGGSFHCGQHRYHRNRDQQRFRVHNDKLLGVVPRRKSWRRV